MSKQHPGSGLRHAQAPPGMLHYGRYSTNLMHAVRNVENRINDQLFKAENKRSGTYSAWIYGASYIYNEGGWKFSWLVPHLSDLDSELGSAGWPCQQPLPCCCKAFSARPQNPARILVLTTFPLAGDKMLPHQMLVYFMLALGECRCIPCIPGTPAPPSACLRCHTNQALLCPPPCKFR